MYNECYLLFASKPFNFDSLEDSLSNLTNWSIAKKNKDININEYKDRESLIMS